MLTRRIQQETYTPQWRESVKVFLQRVEVDAFDDAVFDVEFSAQRRYGDGL
jgi:hypothetical protein